MDASGVVELWQQAMWLALRLGAPVLLAGMIVGLVVGLLQALTQIQDHTLAFVPKLVAMLLAVWLTLPWLLAQMSEYTVELLVNIPPSL